MKVIIDGLPYFLNKGDLGEYTRSLIDGIKPNFEDSITVIKDREIASYKNFTKEIALRELYINRVNNDFKAINEYINNSKGEIYHCTNNGFSYQREYKYNCKVVTTIHSLIPEEHEEFYNIKYLEKYYYSMQLWDRYSDLIIAPSTFVQEELTNKFGIDYRKIFVLPPRVQESYTKQSPYMSKVYIKSKYNFTGDFILYTGDLHKRKRLESFLEIFLRISQRLDNLYFVIMSNISKINYDYYMNLKGLIDAMGLTNRVIFINEFNKADKGHFYNIAKAVIDFSLYECLTMSLLEAKKCKANIICSDLEVYREILGDYPLYLDLELPFIDEIIEDFIESDRMQLSNTLEDYHEEINLIKAYEELLY